MKPSFGMAPLNLLSTDAETEASKGETPCPRLIAVEGLGQDDPQVSRLPLSGQALLEVSPGELLMTSMQFPVNSVLIVGMKRGNEEGRVGM